MVNFEKDIREIKKIPDLIERADKLEELLKKEINDDQKKEVMKLVEETNRAIADSRLWKRFDLKPKGSLEISKTKINEVPNLENVVHEEQVIVETKTAGFKFDYLNPSDKNGLYLSKNPEETTEEINYKPKALKLFEEEKEDDKKKYFSA
ncbi:MAG: hypothetical protein PHE43_02410 [Candidatus Nanoarchaeia archaeon]|nr:hypothetical protein [Candidatus Nanoarchaeia archaeon]